MLWPYSGCYLALLILQQPEYHNPHPMNRNASVGDPFLALEPQIYSASDSLHLHQFKALIFPGNAVSFSSSLSSSGTIKKGRILRIHHNHPLTATIQVQIFISPSEIPSTCKNNIAPATHHYIAEMPELLQTDRTTDITPQQIIGLIYIFREESITSPSSQFNPKGMSDYYHIRYRYSHSLNM